MSRRPVIFILWLLLPFRCFAQVDSTRLAELDKRLNKYFQILEPENVDDATLAKSLAIINALGILGDIIIKFDSAYALSMPGRVAEYVENLAKNAKTEPNEMSIVAAFSLASTAVMGSGIFRGFAKVGAEIINTIKETKDDQNNPADHSA